MRQASLRFLAWVALAGPVAAASCSSDAGNVPGEPPGPNGEAGAGGAPTLPDSLAFERVRGLAPRQSVSLRVTTEPPGLYRVRFSLPTATSDPKDAVLDQSEALTDGEGAASVKLTAPSSSATFTVRASIENSLSAEVTVSVGSDGFGSVRVQPVYGGHRPISVWTATAHVGKTCLELSGTPPPDGSLSTVAAATSAPELAEVQAGAPVAVTLRAAFYAGGCSTIETLRVNRVNDIQVTVLDRPIQLTDTSLSLSLGLTAPETAFSATLSDAASAIDAALLGSSADDVDALLDAMRAEVRSAERASFDSARRDEGWDALLASGWGAGAARRVRETVAGWLTRGRPGLGAGDHVFEGLLSGIDERSAELELATIAGLDAGDAGFVKRALSPWSAPADDTLVLRTSLYFTSSRLATALAEPYALAAEPDAADGAGALALALGCADLAEQLTSAGEPDVSYASCTAECFRALCEEAASVLWDRAREATSLTPTSLTISGAGEARVGANAEVAGVSGTWKGELDSGGEKRPTGGPLIGAEPLATR